jgi:glucose-6-phosphate isomerase
MPGVNAVLAKIRTFSDSVRSGGWRGDTGKPISAVVNIGIGGSDLGPLMVTRALKAYSHPRIRSYYASNVDATHIGEILAQVDPETTLFIIASKTFTTQETMLNAQTARRWLIEKLGNEQAVAKHFVAVSTNTQKVREFGIDTNNMFEFWDWVGGRYSLWSAIGLPIVIAIGMDQFEQMLNGAHLLDNHFRKTPLEKNLPVLLGLLDIWNNDFLGADTHVVLPYDFALEHFSSYLQQLVMESLGKRVTREGIVIDYPTCPIDWGAPGNNAQHAFYQLLHQGTRLVPSDFIVAIESQHPFPQHQEAVLSNALAQTHALMMGRNEAETRASLEASGVKGSALTEQLPHRIFPGNQPSNTIVYQKLTPAVLGALIALYEHKTFVQSVCWNINPFDQWGVELGKQVANVLLPEITGEKPCGGHDGSTDGLLNYIKARLSS